MERRERIRPALVPPPGERKFETLETAPCDIGHQLVAVAEMAIGRGRADTGGARGIGEGEARWTAFRDQLERRLDQRLFEIAVMIFAAAVAKTLHVNSYYIIIGGPTMPALALVPLWRHDRDAAFDRPIIGE